MTNEPSPRPWRVAESVCGWKNCIEDANGNDIGSCWYNRDRLRAEADARLIVDAVNERERMREIVRRLANCLQGIINAANGKGEGVLDESLLREARAAIVEDAP